MSSAGPSETSKPRRGSAARNSDLLTVESPLRSKAVQEGVPGKQGQYVGGCVVRAKQERPALQCTAHAGEGEGYLALVARWQRNSSGKIVGSMTVGYSSGELGSRDLPRAKFGAHR